MTSKQWFKRLKRALGSLPRNERDAAVQFYTELYEDKRENGEAAADILAGFGLPESVAANILSEKEPLPPAPSAGSTVARWVGGFFLFICVGIPVFAVLFSLIVTAASLCASGAVVCLAGIADFVWALIVLAKGTEVAAVAHLGIGIATAGAGLLMIPCFALCVKGLFFVCKKSLAFTGRMMTGKGRA